VEDTDADTKARPCALASRSHVVVIQEHELPDLSRELFGVGLDHRGNSILFISTPISYRGAVDNITETLAAPARAIKQLIEDYGAGWRDLVDIGLSDYAARKHIRETGSRPLAADQAVAISPLGLPDAVALVPLNELGRRYLNHDVYLRDAGLHGQIRLRATHLGYSYDGSVQAVRPINRRWRIGSAAAIQGTGVANSGDILAESDLFDSWPGPATLVELGPPIQVGLRLGFAPSANGAAPAIRSVRHVLLTDLLAAERNGVTLVDVPAL
jgi:hypothetical protein